MKTFKKSIGIICFLLIITSLQAQTLLLPSTWKFMKGDSEEYSKPKYNDSDWKKIHVLSLWESQGYTDYDGIAWYRTAVSVPDSLLDMDLNLLLGKIDDADETYLNGTLIGKSGDFPPGNKTAFNQQRVYSIPKGLLKRQNVIAVRVFDGTGGGGIYSGSVGFFTKEDYEKELNLGHPPKKSFYRITTANGLIDATYNQKTNLVETVYPHLFQMYDFNKPTSPFIRNLNFPGLRKPLTVEYEKNTHVIHIDYPGNVKCWLLAPFAPNVKIFMAIVEGPSAMLDTLQCSFEKDSVEVVHEEKILQMADGSYRKYFLFTFVDAEQTNTHFLQSMMQEDKLRFYPEHEVKFMCDIFRRCKVPADLNEKERNLYEQSICLLKMAQVSQKEVFPQARGQILASLRPGNWNIAWLRDGTYAVMAMSRLKLYKEAKQALDFYLGADCGYYENYKWTDGVDYGVKSPYRLSVCRYFGIGKEESDFNDAGPNVELDGFGLFLTTFADYVKRSGDTAYLFRNLTILEKQIADPMLSFIGPDGLNRKDSGPWEQHLPGRKQAFTSIVNAAGLNALAVMMKENGIKGYEKYLEGSRKLKKGIQEHLIIANSYIKGFEEADSPKVIDYYDGGTIEAFTQQVFTDSVLFRRHYATYEEALKISPERGFSRLNNPDWYTIAEWPFLDTRYAIALNMFGRNQEARDILKSLTDYASLNFNYVAELYDYNDENYAGAVPMIGYGAGAYILAISELYSWRK
ncbi:MAG: hypothetical protein IPH88_18170 [Bacteroidales bacterium]|nr:hypothetical protein [Bacteroidales bacterium]